MKENLDLVSSGRGLRFARSLACLVVFVLAGLASLRAVDGFATVNGTTTGGAAGPTVTVSNLTDLTFYATQTGPYVIQVSGTINLGASSLKSASNKTYLGLGSTAQLVGNLEFSGPVSNCIVQNITFTNSGNAGQGDGITAGYASTGGAGPDHLWIDHCTFFDCADGNLDVTKKSDYVTVSWCKFYYTRDSGHNFSNLIGSDDADTGDRGHLRETWHHNWWSTLCKERMPRVRFGQVHVYNNYYSAAGNNYNIGVGVESQLVVESNYFDGQNFPWKDYYSGFGGAGRIKWNGGNQFVNCTIPTWAANDPTTFTPPYSYTLDLGTDVKALVMAGAGAGNGGPPPPPPPAPAAPSALGATAASSSQINLAWTDNATNEDGFKIERSTDGVNFTQVATTGANVTTYADTGLAASTTYTYRVRATNTGGDSAYSNTASATTLAAPPPSLPAAPSNLTATGGRRRVTLAWTDNATNETGFKIERSTDGVNFTQIATVGANVTSYINTGLTNGTLYTFRVRATNAAGDSAYSNTASATPTNPQ